jgi:RND family efflux transporter MFP subunit
LLDQLRIDRAPVSQQSVARSRFRWPIRVGTAVVAVGAAGALVAFARETIPVRAVVAKEIAPSGGASAGGSLLDASGYVVALREATVSGKSIFKVSEVLVQEGQQIKRDQVMARLDDTNARALLEQSKAQVKQLQAALAAAGVAASDARPGFVRNQKQLAEGLISQDSFDTVKAAYDAARAAVLVAEENLRVAKATVEVNQRFEDDTVIRAPFDGVVTVKTAQPGEIVSPQFSGGGGIAKIVDMDSLEVDVDVSENFINRVHPGQAATVRLNAYPDWQIPAAVIAVIPTADRAKATVKVRIGMRQKDPRIVPEMGAHVSFLEDVSAPRAGAVSRMPGVIIPPEAVQGTGDAAVVFVIKDRRIEHQVIRLGARTDGGQIVLAGLQPGASLAVGDFSKLHDGARVSITP